VGYVNDYGENYAVGAIGVSSAAENIFRGGGMCIGLGNTISDGRAVEIFAKVPYLQHYYDTRCMEEGSSVLERVAEVRS